MIVVTGATGNVGSSVVRSLLERGEKVRAFVRDPEKARRILGQDVELSIGDFDDTRSVAYALDGAERVFLSSGEGPDKVRWEKAVIDAAAAAGIGLVVRASTMGADASSFSSLAWHGELEDALKASGVPWAILRSNWYMTNLLPSAGQIAATGKIFMPAGDARIGMVDPADTGRAGAAVVASDGHEGKTYTVTGPERVGFAQVAEVLSVATGRTIEYVDVPPVAAKEAMAAAGLPLWLPDFLDRLFARFRAGEFGDVADTVEHLTGSPATTIQEFVRNHAAAFSA
jgi:uncharacterized protein YbjT (DUF2867 family)